MEPVRWGVLSTSDFAQRKFVPGLLKSPLVQVAALASRGVDRAQGVADRFGIPNVYGSYEELLADPSIEVIYNPLPNHMHVEWTRKAAEAGKHVMCEKPMGMNTAEVATLLPLASQVHIAEAFMVRFHPQWLQTRDMVQRGSLGRISHMHVAFGYNNTNSGNIRNIVEAGGGALYDIGCYAIVASRWFLGADPIRVAAVTDIDPVFGTDRLTSALLDFGDGRTCTFQVSTQSVFHQRAHIIGSEGRLEITIPFNQPQDAPVTYLTHFGQSVDGLDAERTVVPTNDHYTSQGEAFSIRIRTETPTDGPLRDAIMNMSIIDAIFRSAKSGRFETVA